MTLTTDPATSPRERGSLRERARALRARRATARGTTPMTGTAQDALVRALCHDMTTPLACIEAALGRLDRAPDQHGELLALARAQTAHLSSLLRTAAATGGAARRGPGVRLLRDVVAASVAASGLPAGQLTVELRGDAGEVAVADARVQRILLNLLENAHRHGGGGRVRLVGRSRAGWVTLALTQHGVPAHRVVGHLCSSRPPDDLTGLGLWSVQRQARELGGLVVWDDDGAALTLTVHLPDR
jgi:signal transduction histidine kinase